MKRYEPVISYGITDVGIMEECEDGDYFSRDEVLNLFTEERETGHSETSIIIGALKRAADDIHDPCGITSAMMREAAARLEEYLGKVNLLGG